MEDLIAGHDASNFTTTELFVRNTPDERLTWTGNVPVRLGKVFHTSGLRLADYLGERIPRPEEP